jgi:ATP-dependent Lhr-like helicase
MGGQGGFNALHEKIQKWIRGEKWTGLREVQELSIGPVLSESQDVIISAATASGKTEAAFLPAFSRLAAKPSTGIGILYVSPLKALINDQFRRLESMGEAVALPVTPWHGDAPQSSKNRLKKDPLGALLITPESLESLLLNNGPWSQGAFASLRYIIIDEFHAFIGSERGRQLQSLLRRLDHLLSKDTPRLALSATLGDLSQVARALRPHGKYPQTIIEANSETTELKLQLRGYRNPSDTRDLTIPLAEERITHDLFRELRGSFNLVFCNARKYTEIFSTKLKDKCLEMGAPNEFFPHHGNLSREIREMVEEKLQKGQYPTTAVCTLTLELGVDIGRVNSIAQIDPPRAVASLRQRQGRSGRRGEPSVIRFYVTENNLTGQSPPGDRLRLSIFQSVAMVNLLLNKWYEPANTNIYHFSTLIQQTLSVVGQYGGVRAKELWSLLCGAGPFANVSKENYATLLRSMGEKELLTQTVDGQIVLGIKGERIVSHYTFYAAFNTPEEYFLEYEGKHLGTIPIVYPLSIGLEIIFAGSRWEILEIFPEKKRVRLKPAGGGKAPLFTGEIQIIHDEVRQEMLRLYQNAKIPSYLNSTAQDLFDEGADNFATLGLKDKFSLEIGADAFLFPWLGDRATCAIVFLLRQRDLDANCHNGVITVKNCPEGSLLLALKSIVKGPEPTAAKLAANVADTIKEKHDLFVPEELRRMDYGAKYFDIGSAFNWMRALGL